MLADTHFRLAAAVLGITTGALLSRRTRLEVPKQGAGQSMDDYDPDYADLRIKARGLEWVKCRAFAGIGVTFRFWRDKTDRGRTDSRLAKSKAWYREVRSGYAGR